MRKATTMILFLTLFCFSGCGGSGSVRMEEYMGKKADCTVPVIDERAEKRLIIEYDGTFYGYESELTIVLIGHMQEGNKKGGIRSAVTRDTKEVTESLMRDLMHQTIIDFTSKIENYVKQSSQ